MRPTESDEAVVKEVRIKARTEVVFAFFTDPALMVRWKGVDAMLDARRGGVYRVNVTGRDVARGEYLDIQPYTRIVFTWGWEGDGSPLPPGASTVEVTFTPAGDETIVRLRHSGLTPEMAEEHAQGWEHYLSRLVEAAEGRDPGIDPMTLESPMTAHEGS
jgi:uncharacterized protein YndB with AHSA1/START domain